jgi:hypothetical protein
MTAERLEKGRWALLTLPDDSLPLRRRFGRALVSHVGHCLTRGCFELAFVDAGGGHEDLL